MEVAPRRIGQAIHGAPVVEVAAAVRFAGCLHLAAVGRPGARERIRQEARLGLVETGRPRRGRLTRFSRARGAPGGRRGVPSAAPRRTAPGRPPRRLPPRRRGRLDRHHAGGRVVERTPVGIRAADASLRQEAHVRVQAGLGLHERLHVPRPAEARRVDEALHARRARAHHVHPDAADQLVFGTRDLVE